ncbi:MAG: SH3 domain-containing protein [Acidimicrobiia bacterium]|nr:SH3 domain-containing protein [Acidimicrobiia bacterium]
MKRTVPLLCALMLVLAACGGVEDSGATTTTDPTSTTTGATTTSTTESSTTTTAPDTTTSLPGEPIEFGPREGDMVAVIGVAHDDVLNLRAGPGTEYEIVAEIPNTYDGLTALGNTRDVGDFWIEVDFEGTTGWVHFSFIGFLGVTDDMTTSVMEELGDGPVAETLADIGLAVAETFATDEPQSEIVLVVAPSVGDLGEVTYDVISIGDDAVRGYRVHVFVQPADETFEIKSVEVTTLCGRGVTEDGLCT